MSSINSYQLPNFAYVKLLFALQNGDLQAVDKLINSSKEREHELLIAIKQLKLNEHIGLDNLLKVSNSTKPTLVNGWANLTLVNLYTDCLNYRQAGKYLSIIMPSVYGASEEEQYFRTLVELAKVKLAIKKDGVARTSETLCNIINGTKDLYIRGIAFYYLAILGRTNNSYENQAEYIRQGLNIFSKLMPNLYYQALLNIELALYENDKIEAVSIIEKAINALKGLSCHYELQFAKTILSEIKAPALSGSISKSSSFQIVNDYLFASNLVSDKLRDIDAAANSHLPVMIFGETGTGKTALARLFHARSNRAKEKFVECNCSLLDGELAESRLFGYDKYAFTGASNKGKKGLFAEAEGGTIFLDEIGELPENVQSKILKVVEERIYYPVGATEPVKCNVKIVSATNRDLRKPNVTYADKKVILFRQDLLYRLSGWEFELPPLNSRVEEIIPMAEKFITDFSTGKGYFVLSDDAQVYLKTLDYPGNIRQLSNLICLAIDFIASNKDVATKKSLNLNSEKGSIKRDFFVIDTQLLYKFYRQSNYYQPDQNRELSSKDEESKFPDLKELGLSGQGDSANSVLQNQNNKVLNIKDRFNIDDTVNEFEKELLMQTLLFFVGNITSSATHIGLTKQALYRKLDKHNLRDFATSLKER